MIPRYHYLSVVSIVAAIALLSVARPHRAHAAITGIQRVASGLSSPMFVTHAPGDPTRLFIGLRGGTIRVLDLTTGTVAATPFLSIPSVDAAGEGGLLGMTFHPNYASNGKFYVNVTIDNGGQVFQGEVSPFSTHIRQYTVSADPNVANPAATEILSFIQPQSNHNAGWIGFSPLNGYLYIPTGDGGGGNDMDNDGDDGGHTPLIGNAQDITGNLLGKILRIDVNADDFPADANRNYAIPADNPYIGVTGDDEIWALGLRNPFRDSFDRATGDLWLGDVGQGAREEIDRQPANASGGNNFGWRLREGNIQTPTVGGPIPPNYVAPVFDYPRTGTVSGKTVIGGYVYRGPDPDLQGLYFFADSGDFDNAASNKFWSFDPANPTGTVTNIKPLLTPNVGSPRYPVAYGEDAVGNLYIVYLETNEVYRILTDNLLGDTDGDGDVDSDDLFNVKENFGDTGPASPGDADDDGDTDIDDLVAVKNYLGALPPPGLTFVPEPASAALLVVGGMALLARQRR